MYRFVIDFDNSIVTSLISHGFSVMFTANVTFCVNHRHEY